MTCGILLAAGQGSRFGGNKLLATLPDGTPVGLAAWHNLATAVPDSIAVVRTGDERLRALLTNAGAPVIECHDADVGMSRSLIAGLRAGPDCEGWVIALGDMPFITPATIRSVARALEQGALIAQPVHENQRGHPVGLSSRLREELMQISGDEGARDVIRRHSEHCRLIQCDDPGTLRDIDTRNDLP